MVSAKGGKKDHELLLPDLTNGETSRDVFVSLGLNQPRSRAFSLTWGSGPAPLPSQGKGPRNEVENFYLKASEPC